MIDFNTANSQIALIPAGTIAKAILRLKGGGNHGDDNLLSKSNNTGSIGLNVYFTLSGGKYHNRRIYQLIGLQGVKRDSDNNDIWGNMGRSLIRSILESAYNIHSADKSEKAVKMRNIASYNDLEGLECLIKIGIEEDKTGQYADKNKVLTAITPIDKDYSSLMNNNAPLNKVINNSNNNVNSSSIDNEIPF